MSTLAHAFWPRWYRALARLDPLIERGWRRFGIGNVVRVVIVGRRSGVPRAVFLGRLRVGARDYLGHPDVACAWTLNLDAAGGGELEYHDGRHVPFLATLLEPGPEREAAIRATFRQHPFPGTVLYWLFRRHVRAVGRFYRISEAPAGRSERDRALGARSAPAAGPGDQASGAGSSSRRRRSSR